VKIQLGAQIDGFGTIVCDTIIVGTTPEGRSADLILATHYANELLLRLMVGKGSQELRLQLGRAHHKLAV
jgi:methionine aminopeptidase